MRVQEIRREDDIEEGLKSGMPVGIDRQIQIPRGGCGSDHDFGRPSACGDVVIESDRNRRDYLLRVSHTREVVTGCADGLRSEVG